MRCVIYSPDSIQSCGYTDERTPRQTRTTDTAYTETLQTLGGRIAYNNSLILNAPEPNIGLNTRRNCFRSGMHTSASNCSYFVFYILMRIFGVRADGKIMGMDSEFPMFQLR